MPKIKILKQFYLRNQWWTSARDNDGCEVWGRGVTREKSLANLREVLAYCNDWRE
jgi:hypothetical protein